MYLFLLTLLGTSCYKILKACIFICSSTLFIGEYVHGLYAFPSLVDSSVSVLPNYRPQTLLIDGPYVQNAHTDITGKISNLIFIIQLHIEFLIASVL